MRQLNLIETEPNRLITLALKPLPKVRESKEGQAALASYLGKPGRGAAYPMAKEAAKEAVCPDCLADCAWARKLKGSEQLKTCTAVVLALPLRPNGLVTWLRENGWKIEGVAEDRGWKAVLIRGGDVAQLLAWVRPPAGQGSTTAGNYLPW